MRAISRIWAALAVVLAVAFAAPTPPVSAQMAGDDEFSAHEKRRLERGKLVMRRLTQQRGELRLIGGTSWQVVDLPPDAVWRALQDVSRYNKMLPQVKRARVVEEHGDIKKLHIRHERSAVSAEYYVDVRYKQNKREVFFQADTARPGSLDAAWGFIRVTPRGDGKSLLAWGCMADVGSGLVTGVIRPTVHKWLLKVPQTIKKWVEGSGKSRYLD